MTAYLYDTLGRLARMTNELGQTIVNYDYDPPDDSAARPSATECSAPTLTTTPDR